MKIFKIALALTVLASAVSFTSCNKYEEGPAISLRSAESRIANTWEIEKTIASDGTETAGTSDDPVWTMTKDGDLTVVDGNFNASGTWSLTNEEETLRLTYSVIVSITQDLTILRLTKDELWLEDADGTKTYLREK